MDVRAGGLPYWLHVEDPEQIGFIAQNVVRIAVVSTAIAAALAWLYWERSNQTGILIWLIAFVVIRIACAVVSFQFAKALQRGVPSKQMIAATLVSALAQALAWGCAGFVMVAPGDAFAESVLHLTLAAVVFASIPVLSRYFPLVVAYSVGVFGPLVARNLWIGDLHHEALAILCALGGISCLMNGRAQFLTLTEMYRRRKENAQLIEALRKENLATQEARQLAEAAGAAKSRFFAAANHDLRQPLHAVGLLAQTLRARKGTVDVGEVSERIVECVDSLGHIVDELLELSRIDSGQVHAQASAFSLCDLLEEVAKTYEPLAQAKGLRLEMQTDCVTVQSDRALLARVLSNLVSNAVRYTHSGFVRLHTSASGDGVQLRVEDTGVGIAAGDLPRIFDEFYQVGNKARDRRQGLGLGLATVKRLSDLLGLNVTVQSAPGAGTTFTMHLPLGKEQEQQALPAVAEQAPLKDVLHGKRILVIEDDEASSHAMAMLLQTWGCAVQTAATEHEALTLVTQGYMPEFILADLRLADGQSGCRATEELRLHLGLQLPALIVTGDAAVELVCTAEDANITVMRKPVNPMRLRAYLNNAFAAA
ncbi:MAG: ATP-binding protein [Burkholderiaceae bacterium]